MKTKEEFQKMIAELGRLHLLTAMKPVQNMGKYTQSAYEISNAYQEALDEIEDLNDYIEENI